MAFLDDIFDPYGEYDYANYSDYSHYNYEELEPSLEAQIQKCVDDFKTGQGVSCGINERELEQAMNNTQTG